MLGLSSTLRRMVTLRVDTARGVAELGPWLVTAPTALQAISVYEAVEALSGGDPDAMEGAWQALADVLRVWLPPSMWSRLLAPDARVTCLTVASSLVWEGALPAEKKDGKAKEKAALRSVATWSDVAADVCATYGAEALGWPWPRFLTMAAAIEGVRARAALVDVDALMAAKAQGVMDSLHRRAGFEHVAPTAEEGFQNVLRLAAAWDEATRDNPLA